MKTISLLVEQSLAEARPLAASGDREKLIAHAATRYLNRSMTGLSEPGASVEINEFTTVQIREVDMLDDGE